MTMLVRFMAFFITSNVVIMVSEGIRIVLFLFIKFLQYIKSYINFSILLKIILRILLSVDL